MDCERDSHNPSLKDASSLSQLVDSVVAEVQQSLLNEPLTDDEDEHDLGHVAVLEQKTSTTAPDDDHLHDGLLRTTNEDEELSEYWDQVHYN